MAFFCGDGSVNVCFHRPRLRRPARWAALEHPRIGQRLVGGQEHERLDAERRRDFESRVEHDVLPRAEPVLNRAVVRIQQHALAAAVDRKDVDKT